jgi:hypothetical protein
MYNPFTLDLLAVSSVYNNAATRGELLDIAVTVIIALTLMLICYFVALFAQNAKMIDNSGNEIDL